MLQKIRTSELREVVQLLQAYLNQKLLNNKLKMWKKLKHFNRKPKIVFSTSSFSGIPSKTTRNLENNQYSAIKNIRNTRNFESYGTQRQEVQSKMFSHVKHRPKVQKRNDYDFQQAVLKRIQAIQNRFTTLKSQKESSLYESSSSTLRYRTQVPREDLNQGIRFGLNAKYIPMREKLHRLEPKIFETEESQINNYCDNLDIAYREQNTMFIQTPRIGRRKDSQEMLANLDKSEFQKSSYSLFDQHDKKQKRKSRVSYEKVYNTHKRMLDYEEDTEKSSESKERVLSHKPLIQTLKKPEDICENVQCVQNQALGYHPSVGYFKIIPIGKKLNISNNNYPNNQKIINFGK